MTTPNERTRALRWGLELLARLSIAKNLSPEQRESVLNILSSYPTHTEIKAWARHCESLKSSISEPMLGIEDSQNPANDPELPRGFCQSSNLEVTPQQRLAALNQTIELFEELLLSEQVTREQADEIHFVRRHFVGRSLLRSWAMSEAARAASLIAYRPWLLPESS